MYYELLKKIKRKSDPVFIPFTDFLTKIGVKPIHLTILSALFGVIGVFLVFSKPTTAFPFVIIYILLDSTDGMLARNQKTQTKLGAILDFNIDRLIAIVFLILLWKNTSITLLPLMGLLVIFVTSLEDFGIKIHSH